MCINGALKAPIDKRFRGLKARALVALLIYLGPILRGWERLKWRLQRRCKGAGATEPARPSRADARASRWRERAFYLSYWSETRRREGGAARRAHALPDAAEILHRRPTRAGTTGTSRSRAACGAARSSSSAPRITAAASGCCGCAAPCGCRVSRPSCCAPMRRRRRRRSSSTAPAAAIIGMLGLAQGALIAYRTVEFGRLMHRIIETVAKQPS